MGRAWASPTLAWLHQTLVCIYPCLFGPTTYRKFQMSAFKYFLKINISRAWSMWRPVEVEGFCQSAEIHAGSDLLSPCMYPSLVHACVLAYTLCMSNHNSCPGWQWTVTNPVAICGLCAMALTSTMSCFLRLPEASSQLNSSFLDLPTCGFCSQLHFLHFSILISGYKWMIDMKRPKPFKVGKNTLYGGRQGFICWLSYMYKCCSRIVSAKLKCRVRKSHTRHIPNLHEQPNDWHLVFNDIHYR